MTVDLIGYDYKTWGLLDTLAAPSVARTLNLKLSELLVSGKTMDQVIDEFNEARSTFARMGAYSTKATELLAKTLYEWEMLCAEEVDE